MNNSYPAQTVRQIGSPCSSAGKESACNVGDLGLIPGLGRSPGKRKGYLLQYSGLENSMDVIVHGVAKSQIQLSDFYFHASQDGIKIALKDINNLRYADDTTLMAESVEELKILLMRVKRRVKKLT